MYLGLWIDWGLVWKSCFDNQNDFASSVQDTLHTYMEDNLVKSREILSLHYISSDAKIRDYTSAQNINSLDFTSIKDIKSNSFIYATRFTILLFYRVPIFLYLKCISWLGLASIIRSSYFAAASPITLVDLLMHLIL